MDKIKAIFKNAWPYLQDKMNLPVKNLECSIPFYEKVMDFKVIARKDLPYKLAVLSRDDIQIGIAENGGDPGNEGCFFEVDNVTKAFEELKLNGLHKEISAVKIEQHGETSWKLFYVIAPDGLCFCIGEKQG